MWVRAQLVEALRYNPEGHGFDSRLVSLDFFIDLIFDSASNRNEYQEYFLGEKVASAQG
jgi:hypothetical protein